MQDVVAALERARALDRQDVEWLFDDADASIVPSRIGADGT